MRFHPHILLANMAQRLLHTVRRSKPIRHASINKRKRTTDLPSPSPAADKDNDSVTRGRTRHRNCRNRTTRGPGRVRAPTPMPAHITPREMLAIEAEADLASDTEVDEVAHQSEHQMLANGALNPNPNTGGDVGDPSRAPWRNATHDILLGRYPAYRRWQRAHWEANEADEFGVREEMGFHIESCTTIVLELPSDDENNEDHHDDNDNYVHDDTHNDDNDNPFEDANEDGNGQAVGEIIPNEIINASRLGTSRIGTARIGDARAWLASGRLAGFEEFIHRVHNPGWGWDSATMAEIEARRVAREQGRL